MNTPKEEAFDDALVELGSLLGRLEQLVGKLTDAQLGDAALDNLKQKFFENQPALIDHIGVIDLALRHIQAACDSWIADAKIRGD